MMVHTNEMDTELSGGTSYLDCFRGLDLWRAEIACYTWAARNLCGAGLMAYSAYFYKEAGRVSERLSEQVISPLRVILDANLFWQCVRAPKNQARSTRGVIKM